MDATEIALGIGGRDYSVVNRLNPEKTNWINILALRREQKVTMAQRNRIVSVVLP